MSNRTMYIIAGVIVVIALVIGGFLLWGDDDDNVETTATTSTTVLGTTTTVLGTTTTAAPTTTTAPATTTTAPPDTGCDDGARPADAVAVTAVTGDVDGDGTDDVISTYGAGSESDPAPWYLHVDLGGGSTVQTEITDDVAPGMAAVIGAAEISARSGLPPDGSGEEVFVNVGSGASVIIVGIYQFQECELIRLTGPGTDEPSAFPVGASVNHYDGLRCEGVLGGQRLIRLSAQSADGTTYATTEELMVVEDGAFVVPNPAIEGELDADDPALAEYSTINCEDIEFP